MNNNERDARIKHLEQCLRNLESEFTKKLMLEMVSDDVLDFISTTIVFVPKGYSHFMGISEDSSPNNKQSKKLKDLTESITIYEDIISRAIIILETKGQQSCKKYLDSEAKILGDWSCNMPLVENELKEILEKNNIAMPSVS